MVHWSFQNKYDLTGRVTGEAIPLFIWESIKTMLILNNLKCVSSECYKRVTPHMLSSLDR